MTALYLAHVFITIHILPDSNTIYENGSHHSRQLAWSTIVLRAAKRQLLFLNLLWFLCVTQTIAVWWYYHHGRKDSWGFSDALAYLAGWLTGRLVELMIVSFNLYRLEWCLVTFGPIFILVYSEVLKTQEEKIVFVLFIDIHAVPFYI